MSIARVSSVYRSGFSLTTSRLKLQDDERHTYALLPELSLSSILEVNIPSNSLELNCEQVQGGSKIDEIAHEYTETYMYITTSGPDVGESLNRGILQQFGYSSTLRRIVFHISSITSLMSRSTSDALHFSHNLYCSTRPLCA
jgi:hypothetical protein